MGWKRKKGGTALGFVGGIIVALLILVIIGGFAEDVLVMGEEYYEMAQDTADEIHRTMAKYPLLRHQFKNPGEYGGEPTGEESIVSSCGELNNIDTLDGVENFYLNQTIDCSEIQWTPIDPVDDFESLDGRGFEILNVNDTLFSTNPGSIKNIRLRNVNITDSGAGLVDTNEGSITNSSVSGRIYTDEGAGLVYENSGTITKSFSMANILIGDGEAAGLVYSNDGTIKNSYAVGSIEGDVDGEGAGLVYQNDGGTIDKTYSGVRMRVGDVCGLVCSNGDVSNSFWDIDAAGILPEEEVGDKAGEPRAETQMESIVTYTDIRTTGLEEAWDFRGNPNDDEGNENIWDM